MAVLLQRALSMHSVLAPDVDKVDVMFNGQRIHEVEMAAVERLPDSVLAAMIKTEMREASERRVELSDGDGLYTEKAYRMQDGALVSFAGCIAVSARQLLLRRFDPLPSDRRVSGTAGCAGRRGH
jgi:hypothetical protein